MIPIQFNYFNLDEDKHVEASKFQPIAVITSFQKDGRFIPLKAKIETREEQQVVIDIIQVGKTEETSEMVYFDCLYEQDHRQVPIRLFYLKKQHQWVIHPQ